MSIQIRPSSSHAPGQFNGGAIVEKRPIIPDHGEGLAPYSTLFYWANAWSDGGSTIGEHPHRGFEIMSFVLEGSISHYDSHYREWKPLKAGDAQVIRSGNGISHAERLNAGARMFQIWLDPNLNQALFQPASYDDYPAEAMPVIDRNGIRARVYAGGEGPMRLDTPGVEIEQWEIPAGAHSLELHASKTYSFYLLSGALSLDDTSLQADDFAVIKGEENLSFSAAEASEAFVIATPARPGYATFADRRR